jgi:ketosteroid isomerase-like protein
VAGYWRRDECHCRKKIVSVDYVGAAVTSVVMIRKDKFGIWRTMMKFIYGLATCFLVLVATAALALGQTPRKTGQEDVAATVAVMDHIWLDAAHNRDTGTMEWLFADDFVEIHPGGEIVDKTQQIDQIKDPSRNIEEIHPDDINVIYSSPDVAVVLDTTTIRGLSGSVNYNGKYKVIRVFVKQQGRWRAAGAGIAPITP